MTKDDHHFAIFRPTPILPPKTPTFWGGHGVVVILSAPTAWDASNRISLRTSSSSPSSSFSISSTGLDEAPLDRWLFRMKDRPCRWAQRTPSTTLKLPESTPESLESLPSQAHREIRSGFLFTTWAGTAGAKLAAERLGASAMEAAGWLRQTQQNARVPIP